MTQTCMTTVPAYVVGFLFAKHMHSVALIIKDHPKQWHGLMNGVGGKIELGESPIGAMMRECEEEFSVPSVAKNWHKFHQERFESKVLHFYATRDLDLEAIRQTTSEVPVIVPTKWFTGRPAFMASGYSGLARPVFSERFSPENMSLVTVNELMNGMRWMYNLPYLITMAHAYLQLNPDERYLEG